MTKAIETFHLEKKFSGVPVLQDLTININRGEVVGLLGQNGAGKSITIKLLAGLIRPTGGDFALLGKQNPYLEPGMKERVAYLSQSLGYPPEMNVVEVMKFCSDLYPNWDFELQTELEKNFDLPLKKNTRELSVGMRLRLALTCAFCQNAEIILLDEPTGNLDPIVRNEFLENLASILDRNSPAVVYATHLLEPLERIATRFIVLKDGKKVFEDTLENLEERYRKVQVIFPCEVPPDFSLSSSIAENREGRTYSAIVSSCFNEGISRSCDSYNASFDLYPVSLEDLFIALHSEEGQSE